MKNSLEANLIDIDLFELTPKVYFENIGAKKVIIWGTAEKGNLVFKLFEKFSKEYQILNYADNNPNKWGEEKNGLKILSPNDVKQLAIEDESILITIGTENLAIRQQLISYGIKEERIDIKGLGIAKDYFKFAQKTPFEIIQENYNEFKFVYNNLEDELSKQVFTGVLNMKISLDNKYIEGLASPEKEQYFARDLIQMKENEIFVDCGSFNGDTLAAFLLNTNKKFEGYIAFEADKQIFMELNENIVKGNLIGNVTTYNYAVWDKEEILRFQVGGTAGNISSEGNMEVQANSLDNVLKDSPVTFVKMDIEGAEVNALHGAETLIKNNQPILAICLYHELEHFYQIPNLIKKFNPDYKLFIRHYRDLFDLETVCYAIPKHRLI